jgi:aminoglycoside/choline kinase family phosphotransferase
MQWNLEQAVRDLFVKHYGHSPEIIRPLPASGSDRKYFRIFFDNQTILAAFNPYPRENRAFIYLSRLFREKGLPVPQVIAQDHDEHCYLLNDLGDTTLFSLLPHDPAVKNFSREVMEHYSKVVQWLPKLQVDGAKGLDFKICYPRHAFDRQSMMWDLNYFKYYYLKISGIPFDEQKLEEDFQGFANHLLKQSGPYFMYRDFQSRNIMIHDNQPWFIDYQGGRKGPLQYDIASLLYDAKANIPFHQREEFLDQYIENLVQLIPVKEKTFRRYFHDFVIMRILQALGTYGFRGGVEKKPLFLQSVPYAMNNLRQLSANNLMPSVAPYLSELIIKLADAGPHMEVEPSAKGLTVRVSSFSYRTGIPNDTTGNGGGFVFDCRAIPNPGRQQEYRHLTGKDQPVKQYLEAYPEVKNFLDHVTFLVDQAVKNYQERNFSSLMVSFGCTGGQHRSVYFAEAMTKYIREKFNVNVTLKHYQGKQWPVIPSEDGKKEM